MVTLAPGCPETAAPRSHGWLRRQRHPPETRIKQAVKKMDLQKSGLRKSCIRTQITPRRSKIGRSHHAVGADSSAPRSPNQGADHDSDVGTEPSGEIISGRCRTSCHTMMLQHQPQDEYHRLRKGTGHKDIGAVPALSIRTNQEHHILPGLQRRLHLVERLFVGDRLAIDLQNHVAPAQVDAVGKASRLHFLNDNSFTVRQIHALSHFRRD